MYAMELLPLSGQGAGINATTAEALNNIIKKNDGTVC